METIENQQNQKLKVYLKIKQTSAKDTLFFNISESKKYVTLIEDKRNRNNKPKASTPDKININYDKIFRNEENSYIYEEIMLNTVKESLQGKNFTFISYGDSKSEKLDLIIGNNDCYDNIARRGLFPRLLTALIDLIDSTEDLCNNISISLSYFVLTDGKIIDLCQLIGLIGKKKKVEKYNKEKFIKEYAKEIKNDSNALKHIKKLPCENAKDALFMLLQFMNFLDKIGNDDDTNMNNEFLQLNYFNTIIYITDNNGKNTTLSFIILPCNDIIINDKNNYNKNQIGRASCRERV